MKVISYSKLCSKYDILYHHKLLKEYDVKYEFRSRGDLFLSTETWHILCAFIKKITGEKTLWNNTGYTQKNGAVSKLTRDLFLTLHGHNVHRQQRQLSKFLMRYQQFASHAYCGAAGPVSKMASQ